jgi:2-methylcitrate dehydratase PrpD
MSKRMHHGFSARNGLYAAYLAAGGYTGIKRVFEREYGGFLAVFGEGHDPDASRITADLGQVWETRRIAIKPYAAMGALHGPLDGIFDIMRRRSFRPEEVERIQVDMTHAGYNHGWWKLERPITPIGAQMNVGYALAVAILDGEAMIHQFSPRRIEQDDVWNVIPKIEARHDPSLDGATNRGSRVTVYFKDGTSEESAAGAPRTVSRPMSNEDVVRKFRTLTNDIIDTGRQEAIIETVLSLETLGDIGGLVRLLAAPVGAAF